MPFYVVNAGRGRSTHIMASTDASTPDPRSPESIIAQLLWFGGNAKSTLCGLQASRHVDVFTPAEASCRECKKRWQLAQAAQQEATQRRAAQQEAARQWAAQQEAAQQEAARQQAIRDRQRRKGATCQAQYEAWTDQMRLSCWLCG